MDTQWCGAAICEEFLHMRDDNSYVNSSLDQVWEYFYPHDGDAMSVFWMIQHFAV